ncbi:MAG: metallophosphoesterase [Dehalococcoidia bacterium]|nr:metallophosphoesterase [Dehalococcoidia bacterium]
MKIAVTADLHLAVKEDYPERYDALENTLRQIEAQSIQTLLIAGDLFDKDFHNYSAFESLCKKYPRIQIHIIPGNHDANISEKSIVSPNIHIYTDPTALMLDNKTFLFVPYKEKAKMSEQIAALEEDIIGKEWFLVSHGDYYGGTKELNPLEPGTYMPISKKNIETYKPRAVFLGHIHKPINWSNVYYAGSPCGLNISETGKRRFLLCDTMDGSVTSQVVENDVVYFDESFFILPLDNEVSLLKQETAKRISSWNLDPSDCSKVIVRVRAIGYALDRSAVLAALRESFNGFRYYNDEGPLIDMLSSSTDQQLNAIAERTMKLIDQLEWDFGGDQPERETVKIAALDVIYGT